MTDHLGTEGHKGDASLDRLLFFSDGVFAIAITLLSIELHPPQNWNGTVADLWARGWPMLSSFAVSFLVIGVFWNVHRRIFVKIRRFSHGVFIFNLMLLAAIALMPFATNLIYAFGPRGDALLIYLGLVAIAGVLQGLVYGYAAFINGTLDPAVTMPQRVLAFLSMVLLPGMVCFMSLALTGGGSTIGLVSTLVVIAGLLAGRRFLDKRLSR
jgi:uncharacterized membrane protein